MPAGNRPGGVAVGPSDPPRLLTPPVVVPHVVPDAGDSWGVSVIAVPANETRLVLPASSTRRLVTVFNGLVDPTTGAITAAPAFIGSAPNTDNTSGFPLLGGAAKDVAARIEIYAWSRTGTVLVIAVENNPA